MKKNYKLFETPLSIPLGIIIGILLIFFLQSCWHPVEQIEVKDINGSKITNDGIQVITVGNHQYLWVSKKNGSGGLCHYWDCEYCQKYKIIIKQ